MFIVPEFEAKKIQKELPTTKLKVLSKRKRKHGHTYLMMDDDHESLSVLCKLRGKTEKEILAEEYKFI